MRHLTFAANWKMHIAPAEARAFASAFLAQSNPVEGRTLWFFPSAVSLEAAANAFGGRADVRIGAQDVHWEAKGAFTGATSIPLAHGAGATGALVGHSERRHVFGESDEETGRKVAALLAAGLTAMLCVGEQLSEREAGQTQAVCLRQLRAGLGGMGQDQWGQVVIAYEPVWAIGTGRNATPGDAASVHAAIRAELGRLGAPGRRPVLYGGSVNQGNVASLLAESEIDGVLVGGASLDPAGWARIVATG
ncbi:MAG: triose-phosphate isomerase [Gemmatimonadota bacterium]|nr:triose-phosphate isomerase [Gemmatimonadota bacterium]MDH5282405.1 triose-phosphate isomerase [Gemmatimonadota bacterium]